MKITGVESIVVRVPLREPVYVATQGFTDREFNIVRVTTDEGITGCGYARGGALVHQAVEIEVTPCVLGRDPLATESLWRRVYEATALVGRRGAVMRALSAVDIALWDIRSKAAGLPLFRLLGSDEGRIEAYVSGGYYRLGQRADDLAGEVADLVERGFRRVKVRVGRLPPADDAKRLAAVRRAVGDDVELMVDANQAYRSAQDAIAAGRRFQDHAIRWLEEPVSPDDHAGSARVAAALEVAVATGETEASRWGFRDLIDRAAADILQPDVTVVGGVSEWLKVATLASVHHLPLAPHYFTEVHAQLAAATPHTIAVEYFTPDSEIISFDPFLEQALEVRDGVISLGDRPGVGLDLRLPVVERYRVA